MVKLSEISDLPELEIVRAPKPMSPAEGADDITSPGPLSAEAIEPAYDNVVRAYRQFQVKHQGDDWSNAIIDVEVNHNELQDAGLPNNTSLTWRCRDIDVDGNVSAWSVETNFSVVATQIVAPTLLTPSDNETGISIISDQLLEAGSFVINDGQDVFDKAQWEVLEPNTSTVVWSTETTQRQATIPSKTLDAQKSYDWRARYKGRTWGWSNWSSRFVFTTGAATVVKPTAVSPSNGATGIDHDGNLTLKASDFQVIGDTDRWIAAEWELYEGTSIDPATDSPKWVKSMGSSEVATQTTVPASNFDPTKTYQWRVRYEGDRWGWSVWSDLASFTTHDPYIAQPTNDHPNDGTVGVDGTQYLTLAATGMEVVGGTDSVDTAEWELYIEGQTAPTKSFVSASNTVSVAPGDLSSDTNYEWRMRYTGVNWGTSPWSEKTAFSTSDARVDQPTNQSPSDGTTDVDPDVNQMLSADAFNVTGGSDNFAEAQWELYTGTNPDPANETAHWSQSNLSTDATISASNLSVGTTYHWRVRYRGETWGWSRWSDLTSFEAINPEVAQPSNLTPSDGTTSVTDDDLTLEASDFTVNDGNDTFVEAQWELYKQGDTTPVWTNSTTNIAQPTNLSPDDNAYADPEQDLTLEASDFVVTDGTDTFAKAEWELYQQGGNTPIWTNTTNS